MSVLQPVPYTVNEFGQPIGEPLPHWTPRPLPGNITMQGKYCRLEPFSCARHASDLFESFHASSTDDSDWTYMFAGPFKTLEEFQSYASAVEKTTDPKAFAIINVTSGKAVGMLAYLRIEPNHGAIEVGHVRFSQTLKQTSAATEAQYLMMKYAFETLGYRRYEWKCDSLNVPSCKAAERLGFTFEGIFRQAIVYRGRSRDTAWFAMIDKEWPVIKAAFEAWLCEENFDVQGRQIKSLTDLRKSFSEHQQTRMASQHPNCDPTIKEEENQKIK